MEDGTAGLRNESVFLFEKNGKGEFKAFSNLPPSLLPSPCREVSLSLRFVPGLMAKVVIKVGPITPNRESLCRIPKCEMVTKQPQPHLLT